MGCRIAGHGHPVPREIIDLILGKSPINSAILKIMFFINEDAALLPDQDQSTGVHSLQIFQPDNSLKHLGYSTGQSFKWLNIFYSYYYPDHDSMAQVWIPGSQCVNISHYAPLSPEMRQTLKEKVSLRKKNKIRIVR